MIWEQVAPVNKQVVKSGKNGFQNRGKKNVARDVGHLHLYMKMRLVMSTHIALIAK
jgi:hypothetical protein